MSAPQRIRLSRAKGWRLPANAVNVARPGRWGNLFIVGRHGTRAQCAAMFYQLARGFITFSQDVETDAQLTMYRRIRRHVRELEGMDLACWCALDGGACHGDILLLLANPGLELPEWMKRPVDLPSVRLGMAASDIERHRRRRFRLEKQEVSE